MAVIAIQGCGGGNSGPLQPNRTPQPVDTPIPGVTATPVPGTTPVPTAVPGRTPTPNPPAGDNIGRYSNATQTNGQNNADASNFVPDIRELNAESIGLQETRGRDASGKFDSQRTFAFSIVTDANGTSSGPGFAPGQSYSLNFSGTGPRIDGIYTQEIRDASAPRGTRIRPWRAVSGTLTIDSVTRDALGLKTVNFRVVNARFEPVDITSPTDPNPALAQGKFTFNVSGTAVNTDNV